jgi:shikimate dehydrogenase
MTGNDHSISPTTRLCAVIGNPVGHSLSPALHNAAFRALGLDYVYVAFRVEDLQSAVSGMRALENFRGLSVTIPHKIEIMHYMDHISELDRAIGSINTVINDDGKLTGVGTDGPGALKAMIDAGVTIDGANVLLLGAGGAARALAFTLAMNSSLHNLHILDINEPMLAGLVADLRKGTAAQISNSTLTPDNVAKELSQADIIVNCTPVGMHPRENESIVQQELLRSGQTVFDIVYNPLETKLLADARRAGCRVISGVEMFINQAVLQFELFTNATAPVEVMRKIVMERLGR